MAGGVVAEDEEGVVVAGQDQGQGQGRRKAEMEATLAVVGAMAATGHGIRRGKVKTRRDRRITIESEDTTRK